MSTLKNPTPVSDRRGLKERAPEDHALEMFAAAKQTKGNREEAEPRSTKAKPEKRKPPVAIDDQPNPPLGSGNSSLMSRRKTEQN